MMVMGFTLPVQRCMMQVGKGVHRRADPRQRHRLPEHAKQNDEENG